MSSNSRRIFLKSAGTTVLGGAAALTLGLPGLVSARGNNTLKIGLVGCGGRGTGAASQALKADPDVILYSVADIFEDRIDNTLDLLKKIDEKKVQVDRKRRFTGFDAYQKVIDSGVDVVLLATPPNFRPMQLAACIEADKHVFYEKPVAIDAPGVRKVIEVAKKAQQKKLSMVCGLCFRYDQPKVEMFDRVLKGDIGEIKALSSIRYGGPWHEPVRQPGWTDMEYQVRFWYYHNWLSGDFNVEQFVHSMDMISWALGEKMPVRAVGTGGRQQRTDPKYGNIYDHFSTFFEYDNGVNVFTSTRQQRNTAGRNSVEVMGSLGNAFYEGHTHKISGKNNWQYQGEPNDMYQEEHNALFRSIRSGLGTNDGERAANSTMMAVLSRMAAYTGKSIRWEEAINSEETLGPEEYTLALKYPDPGIPIPGITKVL